jgi:hypothetical protein
MGLRPRNARRGLAERQHTLPDVGSWRLAPRQAHRKDRALARLARYGHVAAHHARELSRDGKAEPRTAEALRRRGIGLAEFLEQLRLLVCRHTDAGVGNGHLDPVATVADPPRSKLDLTLLGELTCIA